MRSRPPQRYSLGLLVGLAGRLWGGRVQPSPGLTGEFRSPSQFSGNLTAPEPPWTSLG
jgi:hypothetical protein